MERQSIAEFEARLADNLYKLWHRRVSGRYPPKPVRRGARPKANGGVRPLGLPPGADRIAQRVVKRGLAPELDRGVHLDAYGYRSNKSAQDALRQTRRRCGPRALALDLKSFFDTMDPELWRRAVKRPTQERRVRRYIKRGFTASGVHLEGREAARDRGTPQGGVLSPLRANLFLPYGFDLWRDLHVPSIPFERYADEAVGPCASEPEAQRLRSVRSARFAACGLQWPPEKPRIVYCKDPTRRGR